MTENEGYITTCPRCGGSIRCNVDDIARCWCTQLYLSRAEREFIADRYEDCLCEGCLQAIKTEMKTVQEKGGDSQ
ncbi:MAG: cysteine-rich CWC family protein [Chitinophaga sp.]|uniref:cysteine-rich CWC family protein n=1 Tax=Chitinophaga sp. TaxID=1869181 RepID=UPI00345A9ED2|nr:cysteine-rich CWC family protein [Chitinophaga sp.]